jgi:hypothetical protein
MDELFIKKQQQDLNILNIYNKILIRVHNKIKYTSKQLINDECCWYIVPEFLIGTPKYNNSDCIAFIIDKLRDNGFIVRYTHPNLLFISWKQWIPTYVRNEIKKKTGKHVDEYGNLIEINDNNEDNNNIILNENNLFSNKLKNVKDTNDKNNYKDTKSYKPTGMIYSENLLKKLNI